jgi:polyisoprenoid-binding protein YceI
MAGRVMRRWKLWLGIGVVAALVLVAGGPYVYIHFIEGEAPAPLVLSSTSPAVDAGTSGSSTTASGTDGTWNVTSDPVVGYRVKEVLFGQSNEAAGRTSDITGSMEVDGTTIPQASFTVDMTTVTSDESRRDDQFNGRIMETSTYPTATFELTEPIELDSIPPRGEEVTLQTTGDLTLHGVTKSVTFDVNGRYNGSTVDIAGSIPITFADYDIGNPSFGGVVTTEDHGLLEFSLTFTHE